VSPFFAQDLQARVMHTNKFGAQSKVRGREEDGGGGKGGERSSGGKVQEMEVMGRGSLIDACCVVTEQNAEKVLVGMCGCGVCALPCICVILSSCLRTHKNEEVCCQCVVSVLSVCWGFAKI